MEGFALGWRDGILLLVALAAIYLVFMLLRLTQVRRLQHAHPEHDAPDAPKVDTVSPLRRRAETEGADVDMTGYAAISAAANAAYAEAVPLDEPFAVPPATENRFSATAPSFAWDEVDELLGNTREAQSTEARPASAAPVALAQAASIRSGGFGEHLADHLARSDVEMEVQRMRDEMERMRAEMEELRVARRVSPQYAEAMELSQRGLSAQDVADRLGISLAEAELVHALSRGDKNFDEGGEDGEDRYVASDEFDAFDGRRTSGRR